MPAGTVSAALLSALIPETIIPQGPIWSPVEILALPIPFLATCAQYYLVGLLLDKFVEYRRQNSDRDETPSETDLGKPFGPYSC